MPKTRPRLVVLALVASVLAALFSALTSGADTPAPSSTAPGLVDEHLPGPASTMPGDVDHQFPQPSTTTVGTALTEQVATTPSPGDGPDPAPTARAHPVTPSYTGNALPTGPPDPDSIRRAGPVSVGPPALPRGAPPIPLGRRPIVDRSRERIVDRIDHDCYPPGPTSTGYQDDCVNPGFAGASVGGPFAHWGDEPYYNTGRRFVWLIDELGPSREREWLQYTVRAFNDVSDDAGTDRPIFLYYTGEQIGWGGCAQSQPQFLVVCYNSGQVGSFTRAPYSLDTGHFVDPAQTKIGSLARNTNDFYIEYSIVHEFGHDLGFAHDTHCWSVMTYCLPVDAAYRWYDDDQTSVYIWNYDWGAHQN